jgi:heme-degrading monooxygenase HmoA
VRVPGDPAALEAYASANAEQMRRISGEGKSRGAIHHMFAAGDGEVLVIDEWDTAEHFQEFFEGQPEIPQIMQAAGATGAPEISFYRKLDTPDHF